MAKVSIKKKLLAGLLCLTMLSSSAIAGMMSVSAAETGGTGSSSTVSALTNNSTISATSVFLGDTVTLKAVAEGGTAPYQYAFTVRHSTATGWTTVKSYNTTATKDWKPTLTGTYQVCAKVKDASGKEVKKFFNLTVSKGVLTNKSTVNGELIDNQTVGIIKGESITLEGVASYGTAPYKYAFSVKHESATTWSSVKGYNTTATKVWKPALKGTYQVCAKVKDADGTEIKKFFNLGVSDSLENKSSISSYIVEYGKSVKMNAEAEGGSGEYTYSYAVEPVGGTKKVVKDFSTVTTFDYAFTDEGTYKLYITVKDSYGIKKEKVFAVSVYKYYKDNISGTDLYRIVDKDNKTVSYLGTTKSTKTITVNDHVQLTVDNEVGSYKVVGVENLGAAKITAVSKVKLPVTLEFVGDSVFENIGVTSSYGTEVYFDNNESGISISSSNLKEIGENAFRGAWIKQITLGGSLVNIPDNAFDGADIEELILEDGFNTADGANISTNLFKKTANTSGATINKVVLKGDNVRVTDDWFKDSNTGDSASIELETGITSYFYSQHKFDDEDFSNKFSIKCNTTLSGSELTTKGITVSFVSASKGNSNIDYTGKSITSTDIKYNGYIKVTYSNGDAVYLPTKLLSVTVTSSATKADESVEFTVSSATYGLGSGISCTGTITKVAANSDNIAVTLTNARKIRDDYYMIDLGYSVDENGNVSIENIDDALNRVTCTVKYRGSKDLTSKSTIKKNGDNAKLVYYEDTKKFGYTGTPTIKVVIDNDNDYCLAANSEDHVAKTIKFGISIKLKSSTVSVTYVDEEGMTNSNVEAYKGVVEEDRSNSYNSSLLLPSTASPFSSAINDISVSVYTYCKAKKSATTESIKLVTLEKGVDYAIQCSTDLDTDGNGTVSVKIKPKTDFLNTDFNLKFRSLTVVAD